MKDARGYADAWSRLRSMRQRSIGLVIGGMVGFPVLALVVKHARSSMSSLCLPGCLAVWFIGVLWSSVTVMSWACPRCRRPFFHAGVTRSPFAKRCVHCALPYGALENDRAV